jgi:hypothetical protein
MLVNFFWELWDCIHIVARALPHGELNDLQRLNFIQWLTSFAPLVPCPGCQEHAMKYLLTHPIRARTGDEAFEYTVEFHNVVNRMNGKPVYTPQQAEAELEARCAKEFQNIPRLEMFQKQANAKILALEKALEAAQLQQPHASGLSTSNHRLQVLVIIVIVIASLALLAILLLGCMMLAKLNAHITLSNQILKAGVLMGAGHMSRALPSFSTPSVTR